MLKQSSIKIIKQLINYSCTKKRREVEKKSQPVTVIVFATL